MLIYGPNELVSQMWWVYTHLSYYYLLELFYDWYSMFLNSNGICFTIFWINLLGLEVTQEFDKVELVDLKILLSASPCAK